MSEIVTGGDIQMHFSFTECGTDFPDTTSADLIYRNTIQGQEYYENILMGVQLRFQVVCTGDRDASISQENRNKLFCIFLLTC